MLPISNPKSDLHNVNAQTKFDESPFNSYLLNLSSENENMDVLLADTSVKIDEICPLAILNQIATISMHIPNLVKIHRYLVKLSSVNETMDLSQADNFVKN